MSRFKCCVRGWTALPQRGVGPRVQGAHTHSTRPRRGRWVGLGVPLLRLPVHFLVEAIEDLLHIFHGEDTDGRALRGPPVPAKQWPN
jgi:hypothetical protein